MYIGARTLQWKLPPPEKVLQSTSAHNLAQCMADSPQRCELGPSALLVLLPSFARYYIFLTFLAKFTYGGVRGEEVFYLMCELIQAQSKLVYFWRLRLSVCCCMLQSTSTAIFGISLVWCQ
eukprot:4374935-Amphidinium_carterae.2